MNLSKFLPLENNPRMRKKKGIIFKTIVNSINDNYESDSRFFEFLNRGITMSVSAAKSVAENVISLEFCKGDGILDGGHTYQAIIDNRKSNSEQIVKIELLIGLSQEQVYKISKARNIADKVRNISAAANKGELDFIKNKLAKEQYFKYIEWKQNESESIKNEFPKSVKNIVTVQFLIQLFSLFNIDHLSNSGKKIFSHLKYSYSGKEACVKNFLIEIEKSPDNAYTKMSYLFRDIISLYSIIAMDYGRVIEHSKRRRAEAGKIRSKYKFEGENNFFLKIKESYRYSQALIMPILAIFRCMLEEKNGKYSWKQGADVVFRTWNAIKKNVIIMSFDEVYCGDDNKKDLGKCGKSSFSWCYMISEGEKHIKRYLKK